GTADGERDEQFVHLDNYGKFAKDPHLGNRSIYNVFYVRHVDANGTPEEPYGQAANGPTGPSTQIAEFEDSGAFVYAEAKHLEDMYRVSREGPLVEKWTRRIVFARPNRVIVFDETAAGEADADQFMAWNFSGEPLAADDAARRDIRYGNDFAGSVTQVLPEGAKGTCVNLFSANKVWQLQVRPGTKARLQTWITVFDLSESREAVAVAKAIPVREGRAAGVLIAPRGSQASATLFVTQPFDNAGPDTIRYVIPGRSTRHLITGLHGGSRYFVACARDGADITVSVKGGGAITASGGFIASSAGVLSFATSESGEVR
ncbi:MAG: hypothetical protein JO061_10135, partial [Acidobacteriaceae bacterium]|nr:hypothetical protein [Acidobacteriaceae bacterium]